MPYQKMDELPDAVKALPAHGREIWMAAFNSAWEQYEGDEEKCFATAWAAVAKKYQKKGDEWVKIEAKTIPVFAFKEISSDAPPEFQLLPDGEIEIEGDLPAYLDPEAADLILRHQAKRKKDIVIDYEHQTLKDVQAPASGWIKRLAYKGREGLWAAVEWTKRGRDYIQAKEYRYFSPVMWIRQSDRKVVGIDQVALTNAPMINNLQPIVAKMSLDQARQDQEARSKEYGIAVKEGGHVTKPSEWEGVDDDQFLDPVNYRYPCPDADQTRSAAAYWGRPDNQAQYSSEERSIINKRLERFKEKFKIGEPERKEAKIMLEKLRKLLGLAADAAEAKVEEAVQLLVNKVKSLETVVACKEVLEAIGAKAEATKEEVVQIVASLKAPADVAKTLSLEVASLKKELQEIKQNDLVQLALKEGKTSPEELDKWGRNLALKNPDQFKVIVLSRPAGSVIPIGGIPPGAPARDGGMDEVQKSINKMVGIPEETWKKYNSVKQ
jgi:phage I-like protein/cation transport regulator ChaB